jgi:hypothetical protein
MVRSSDPKLITDLRPAHVLEVPIGKNQTLVHIVDLRKDLRISCFKRIS